MRKHTRKTVISFSQGGYIFIFIAILLLTGEGKKINKYVRFRSGVYVLTVVEVN